MKKFIALAVLAVTGVALASTLSVPWFVDKGVANVNQPPTASANPTTVGIVFLHNNKTTEITCAINYYNSVGNLLPWALNENPLQSDPTSGLKQTNNTFVISANATIAFRPNTYDPSGASGAYGAANNGQESAKAILVPDRPCVPSVVGEENSSVTSKRVNGSIVVSWIGESTDVQGIMTQGTSLDSGTGGRIVQFGTLLPPGASN